MGSPAHSGRSLQQIVQRLANHLLKLASRASSQTRNHPHGVSAFLRCCKFYNVISHLADIQQRQSILIETNKPLCNSSSNHKSIAVTETIKTEARYIIIESQIRTKSIILRFYVVLVEVIC
jgi:predicted ATPase